MIPGGVNGREQSNYPLIMSKSMLAQITESEWFRSEVRDLIQTQVFDRECICYPSGSAMTGAIVDYDLTGPLVFAPAEGEGLRFHVGVESRGVTSGQCKTPEGEHYTYARDSPILGQALVEFGPDTLLAEGVEQIVEPIDMDVGFICGFSAGKSGYR